MTYANFLNGRDYTLCEPSYNKIFYAADVFIRASWRAVSLIIATINGPHRTLPPMDAPIMDANDIEVLF